MLTREIIVDLKRTYKEIFSVELGSKQYAFRAVTFAEFDEISLHEGDWSTADAEDALVALAVVYPFDFDVDKCPAGHISTLADEILVSSGFSDPEQAQNILDKHRETMSLVRQQMVSFVITAMPSYKETDLENITFSELAKKTAYAEQIFKVQQAVLGIEDLGLKLVLFDREPEAQEEAYEESLPPNVDPIALKLHQALGQM